jgi:LuxR family maltose regulon positive regulatory protein
VDGWLLMARVRLEEGKAVAARTALTRALELARVEGHRRPFVDAGPWLRPVLHAHPDVLAGHEWLGPPLTHGRAPTGGGATTREAAQPVEPLTERERTVLTRMAQAMSIEDIAADLFLSVNTIKTHQRSIYRKLSVSRRNDAVRRARELRLT